MLTLESVDLPAGWVIDDVLVDTTRAPIAQEQGASVQASLRDSCEAAPYVSSPPPRRSSAPTELRLIPYHRWADRGTSTMRVFLPTDC